MGDTGGLVEKNKLSWNSGNTRRWVQCSSGTAKGWTELAVIRFGTRSLESTVTALV